MITDFNQLSQTSDNCGGTVGVNSPGANLTEVKIIVIDATDMDGMESMSVSYTCPESYHNSTCDQKYCSPEVYSHPSLTDSTGEMSLGYFKAGGEMTLHIFPINSNHHVVKQIKTFIVPDSTDSPHNITFEMVCEVGYFGDNCISQCSSCYASGIESCYATQGCNCKEGYDVSKDSRCRACADGYWNDGGTTNAPVCKGNYKFYHCIIICSHV